SYTVPELAGPVQVPCTPAFVGPTLGERPAGASFPWEWLDPARQLVLASLGTPKQEAGARFYRVLPHATGLDPPRAGARFYRVLLDATGLDLQLVLVAPPEMVGPVPAHILVRPSVPQLELLAR